MIDPTQEEKITLEFTRKEFLALFNVATVGAIVMTTDASEANMKDIHHAGKAAAVALARLDIEGWNKLQSRVAKECKERWPSMSTTEIYSL